MTKKIFQAQSSAEIFQFYKNAFPKRKKALSLRQFANLLGYQSPRTIGMIIAGQRFPTRTILDRLIDRAQLLHAEKSFCEWTWEREELLRRDPQNLKIKTLEKNLEALRKKGFTWQKLEKETLRVLGEWHYAVLLAGLDSMQFPQEPEQISKLLGHRVSPLTVRDSMQRLQSLNMITRDSTTNRWKTTGEALITSFDIPDATIKKSHLAVLREAQRALEKYPVADREYIQVAIPVPASALPEIKSRIRAFVLEITQSYWDTETTWIHRLGVFMHPETSQPETIPLAAKKKAR